MYTWLIKNLATILICLVLIAVVTLAILTLIKDKKAGISSCGSNCSHCALAGKCHSGKGIKSWSKRKKRIFLNNLRRLTR